MLNALAAKFGFIRKAVVIDQLQFARSVGKRLDEHRELVEAIQLNTTLLEDEFWHAGHLATQDDYLMRLYFMVYGVWPTDSAGFQQTGEFVRARPQILGKCRLPEYDSDL